MKPSTREDLKRLIKRDSEFFRFPLEGNLASGAKLDRPSHVVDRHQELSTLYMTAGKNDLCSRSMSDEDNDICQSATRALEQIAGDREGAWDFIDEVMYSVSSHYKEVEVPRNCKPEFLLNYLATQAFAIPTHWHTKQKYSAKKHHRLIELKYQAFAAGYVPVGTRAESGGVQVLLWRPCFDRPGQ